jgi:hypothetical protein
MLNKDIISATLNLAFNYETGGYPDEVMQIYMSALRQMNYNERDSILLFLKTTNECTFKLYCETMMRLNSQTNEIKRSKKMKVFKNIMKLIKKDEVYYTKEKALAELHKIAEKCKDYEFNRIVNCIAEIQKGV